MKTKLINGWGKYYETKSTQVLATKLTKGNMKAVAKAIGERLDTLPNSVMTFNDQIIWVTGHITEQEKSVKLGEYLIMTNAWIISLPARDFKSKYDEITPHMPTYYTPTENEVKIIRALSDEYYYPYSYIEDETGLSRSEAKESIDKLRIVGVVRFARGLMTEDGEVAGSGFGIRDHTRADALLYRYYLNIGKAPE